MATKSIAICLIALILIQTTMAIPNRAAKVLNRKAAKVAQAATDPVQEKLAEVTPEPILAQKLQSAKKGKKPMHGKSLVANKHYYGDDGDSYCDGDSYYDGDDGDSDYNSRNYYLAANKHYHGADGDGCGDGCSYYDGDDGCGHHSDVCSHHSAPCSHHSAPCSHHSGCYHSDGCDGDHYDSGCYLVANKRCNGADSGDGCYHSYSPRSISYSVSESVKYSRSYSPRSCSYNISYSDSSNCASRSYSSSASSSSNSSNCMRRSYSSSASDSSYCSSSASNSGFLRSYSRPSSYSESIRVSYSASQPRHYSRGAYCS